MASADLSRRVEKVVGYPLSELGDLQRRELHEALLEAATASPSQMECGTRFGGRGRGH